MRFYLSDDEVDPKKLLATPVVRSHLAEVIGADAGGARAVLQDFVNAFGPRELADLKTYAAARTGFFNEIAGWMYEDDLDPGDEPFEGVLVIAKFQNDEVVLSNAAFERLLDAMVALAPRTD